MITIAFPCLLVILLIASAVTVYSLLQEEKCNNKLISGQKIFINKLETELNQKSMEAEKLQKQNLELNGQLFQEQDILRKESFSKSTFEIKVTELQAQLEKSKRDLSANIQMYDGLKGQYDELERDMEKLQQDLINKDAFLKAEQVSYQELKQKYDSLLKTIG